MGKTFLLPTKERAFEPAEGTNCQKESDTERGEAREGPGERVMIFGKQTRG